LFKLIIIDDEEETREGLIETMEWDKLEISVSGQAEDGIQGYELACKVCPDIALIDVRMPRMNGIECANMIRKRLPECKIIFMSGYTDKEYLKSAIQLQAIDYIEKPIDNYEMFNVIKKSVLICMDERAKRLKEDEIRNKAEYSSEMLMQGVAFELIHRNIDINTVRTQYKDINIPINENYLCILLDFNLHKVIGGENSITVRKNEVLNIIKGRCANISGSYISGVMDSGLAIIHIYGKSAEKTSVIRSILENIQKDINDLYNCDCVLTIGVGKLVRGVENIYRSYQSARKAISKRFILGYNIIVFYKDDVTPDGNAEEELLNNKIQAYVKNIQIENSVEFIENMVSEVMKLQYVDENRIKGIFLSFLLEISSQMKEHGLLFNEDGIDQTLVCARILNFYTLDEIKVFISEKLAHFARQIEEQTGKSKKIRTVMNFIIKNYSDPISIAFIAEQVNLSPNYLCLLFKKETGKTMNEYIEQIRIEKSKELLENGTMKINEIAKRVGYNNPNYFTAVFRKITGMYPSEYRKKVMS